MQSRVSKAGKTNGALVSRTKGTWLWTYITHARITNTLRLQESNDYQNGSSFKEVLLSSTSVPLNIVSSEWTRCPNNLDIEI